MTVAKRLRRLKPVSIATADEGEEIKVRGVVAANLLLSAPYTARACVYYRLEILQSQFDTDVSMHVIEARDFTLRDATGTAEVLVERARFEVVLDFVEMERASALSERARAIANTHGWRLADIAQVEICEAVILPGEPIEVIGMAVREPNPRPGTRASAGIAIRRRRSWCSPPIRSCLVHSAKRSTSDQTAEARQR